MASKPTEITKKTTTPVVKTAKPVKKEAVKVTKPKTEAPVVKKETVKADVAVAKTKASEKKYPAVNVDVLNLEGKVTSKMALPGELFGETVNKALVAQAVRVYLANQRQGNASTKTRGEVEGSTRKIYRQKGTGRARHGGIRAPIFVKGGIVFGPKPRDFSLSLPQKMKRKALFSALSGKLHDKEITFIDGLAGIKPKTKVFVALLKNLGVEEKKRKLLIVTSADVPSVLRAGNNVTGVNFIPSRQLNTYEVLNAKQLIVMKDAVDEMKEHFLGKGK
ncbi:MAG: 50S ribosomal protein L4 [Candidatus Levyibacteriota bacterium]